MAKIIKSITLLPGESFTLPKGATLKASDNEGALTSNCPIPDLEDLNCYAFVFGNGEDDGDDSQLFESAGSSNTPVIGILFNGVKHLFSTPFASITGTGHYDKPAIAAAINGTPAGQLIFNMQYESHDNNDNGVMSYIVFKTTPSIAKSLQLLMQTYAPGFDSETIDFIIPVRDHADVASYANMPACNTSA